MLSLLKLKQFGKFVRKFANLLHLDGQEWLSRPRGSILARRVESLRSEIKRMEY